MEQPINLDYDDCLEVMGAILARARKDVIGGTPNERNDAAQFLEHIFGEQWHELITPIPKRRKAKRIQPN